jgi:hypothetical protein
MPSLLIFVSEGFPYDLSPSDEPDLPSSGPLLVEGWCKCLEKHPDRYFVSAILGIITRGAKIGYIGPHIFRIGANHTSANEAPDILAADVNKQLQAGRLTALSAPLPNPYVCSPLGLVPKHDGGWRRIHDLSYPKSTSVNDGIPRDRGALEYAAVDDAIAALIAQGRGAVLLKEDLADAFRHVPVAISDRWLLGFQWNLVFYMENFLPFGLRTAPFLFDLFAKALHWMLMHLFGWRILLHYLDDFFAVLLPFTDASLYQKEWDLLCGLLGLQSNEKKRQSGTRVEFLGIEMDSEAMEARLPSAKLQRARELVAAAAEAKTLSHQSLEVLVGFLSFCAKVVVPGRAFLSTLYASLAKDMRYHSITAPMARDIAWWHHFLPRWNGIKVLQFLAPRSTSYIWTDASSSWGIGGYWIPHKGSKPVDVFTERYSTRIKSKALHINTHEMRAILYALRLWLPRLCGGKVIIYDDNAAVVAGLNKGSIRGGPMGPLRDIAMLLALNDILIESIWIDSKSNDLADLLSRGKYEAIANKYPQLAHLAVQTPATPPSPGTQRCL